MRIVYMWVHKGGDLVIDFCKATSMNFISAEVALGLSQMFFLNTES